jgi:hypothetical protein
MQCLHMYLFLRWFPFKGNENQYSFLKGFPRYHKISAVSLRPRDPIPWSHWDRGNRFPGLIETAETDSAVSLRPRKPIPRSHWDRWIWFRGLIETAGFKLCTRLSQFSRRKRSHMQNGFWPWIRALGGIVWWKIPRVENLVTLSL